MSVHAYWGKSDAAGGWHPVLHHSLDVAAVGVAFLRANPATRALFVRLAGGAPERWLPVLLALHDLGKYASGFQLLNAELRSRLSGRTDTVHIYPSSQGIKHDTMGQMLWLDRRDAIWPSGGARRPSDILMSAVTGHHGLPARCDNDYSLRQFFDPRDIAAAAEHTSVVRDLLGDDLPDVDEKSARYLSWVLSGFTVLCDWVGSNSEWFPFSGAADQDPTDLADAATYWLIALERAETAIDRAGLRPGSPAREKPFKALFPELASFGPSPLQRYALDCQISDGPNLFILEDLTGSGKTEASLILASRLMQGDRADGYFVAMPGMATSNSMFERMGAAYANLFERSRAPAPSLALAHGKRWMHPAFRGTGELGRGADNGSEPGIGAECSDWIRAGNNRVFLASVGVGTIDQAHLGVLPSRFQSLRLFGLSRRVLIVDEVHACDDYMAEHLQELLRFMGAVGASVVLLSATLTAEQKTALVRAFAEGATKKKVRGLWCSIPGYPAATHWSPSGLEEEALMFRADRRQNIPVELLNSERKALELLVSEAQAGRCGCWIRNTVVDAQRAYEDLVAMIGEDKVTLFHARFAAGDRTRIEAEILKRFGKNSDPEQRRGQIVIATQVIEQSLDIDFDAMVSDIAPIDLLIQRAGRLQRHCRGPRPAPVLYVVSEAPDPEAGPEWLSALLPRTLYVYPHAEWLWRTARLLEQEGGLDLPGRTRHLIEGVFSSASAIPYPAGLDDLAAVQSASDGADRQLGRMFVLKMRDGYELPLSASAWGTDERAPTRLGESRITVRLVRFEDGHLLPWMSNTRSLLSWAEGDVDLARTQIDGEEISPEIEPDAERLRREWGKIATNLLLVPLIWDDLSCRWLGVATRGGKRIAVSYGDKTGIQLRIP